MSAIQQALNISSYYYNHLMVRWFSWKGSESYCQKDHQLLVWSLKEVLGLGKTSTVRFKLEARVCAQWVALNPLAFLHTLLVTEC